MALRVSVLEVPSQRAALKRLAQLSDKAIDPRIRKLARRGADVVKDPDFLAMLEESTVDPIVRNTALAIVDDCASRDDEGEIYAVYNAVKYGDPKIEGLERGLKYMSDPRWADFFSTPARTLKQLRNGVNGGDCDDSSTLIASLLGSLGFMVGLRAWGKQRGEYTHVYALVGFPKIDPTELVPLDATVEEAEPGWEPPGGYTLNAVLDGT